MVSVERWPLFRDTGIFEMSSKGEFFMLVSVWMEGGLCAEGLFNRFHSICQTIISVDHTLWIRQSKGGNGGGLPISVYFFHI